MIPETCIADGPTICSLGNVPAEMLNHMIRIHEAARRCDWDQVIESADVVHHLARIQQLEEQADADGVVRR